MGAGGAAWLKRDRAPIPPTLRKTSDMNPPKTTIRPHLSEPEAAAQLGISVEQLRSLLKERLGAADPDLKGLPNGFFQPSDVVMLRLLLMARQQTPAYLAPSGT